MYCTSLKPDPGSGGQKGIRSKIRIRNTDRKFVQKKISAEESDVEIVITELVESDGKRLQLTSVFKSFDIYDTLFLLYLHHVTSYFTWLYK
jgi:hypothetical protein